MKYLFGLVCLLAAGFLLCAGFYGYQRVMIQMDLKTSLRVYELLEPENEEEEQLNEQLGALIAQEHEQLKRIAKNSATRKEFQQKSEEFLFQWDQEDKMGKVLRDYNENCKSCIIEDPDKIREIMQSHRYYAFDQAETVAP